MTPPSPPRAALNKQNSVDEISEQIEYTHLSTKMHSHTETYVPGLSTSIAEGVESAGADQLLPPSRVHSMKKRVSRRTSALLKQKPSSPPPPPPVDLSTLYCGGVEEGGEMEFASGGSTLMFECKAKGSKLGSLVSKPVQLTLDLNEITLKVSKESVKGNGDYDKGNIFRVNEVGPTKLTKPNELEVHFVGVGVSDHEISNDSSNAHVQDPDPNHDPFKQMHHPTKRYVFSTADDAYRFQKHFEVMKESGAVLKTVFRALDKRGNGHIGKNELAKAMKENGMECLDPVAGDLEVTKMIALADSDTSSGIDFIEFFRLFMFTPCTSVHQALTEWRNKVALDQGKSVRGDLAMADLASGHDKDLANTTILTTGGSSRKLTDSVRLQLSTMVSPENLVSGEIILNRVENVRYSFGHKSRENLLGDHFHWVGTLLVTNYRLILQSHISNKSTIGTRREVSRSFERQEIPVNTIAKIEKLDSSCVKILCKDLRPILCSFPPNDTFVTTLTNAISNLAFPGDAEDAFAFQYGPTGGSKEKPKINGWDLYDPLFEFERIGVANGPHSRFYRVYSDNFRVSDTYPRHFCLPSGMSESDIIAAAKFRSKCRMPAVSWRSKKNGAVLCRCSQPMVGVKKDRCASDEKLLNLYRVRGDIHNPAELEEPSTLYIMDARKQIAAAANSLQGKGTEVISNYRHTELQYCNIENIHVMRDSINQVGIACIPCIADEKNRKSGGFLDQIKESNWLRHVQLVLKAAVECVEKIELNDSSVLVHCSDGWDRTAQMTSISMLLMDPYFRTIRGFAILIEKEWLDFGHKFKDRGGQCTEKKKDERSPVFLQFLDVVHQLMNQFPLAFEFNEQLLVFIADMQHSGLFGTFLGNNAKEREELDVKNKTTSIWTFVLDENNVGYFTNENFVKIVGEVSQEEGRNNKEGGVADGNARGDEGGTKKAAYKHEDLVDDVLWPSTSIKMIKVFDRYFLRWDNECHPKGKRNVVQWLDSWGMSFNKLHGSSSE